MYAPPVFGSLGICLPRTLRPLDGNNANNAAGLHLENQFELSPAQGIADQLKAIAKFLVSPNFKIRKKALDGFFESDSMLRKLVSLEIIFEIFRRESAPIDHTPLYYALRLRESAGSAQVRAFCVPMRLFTWCSRRGTS